MRYFNKLYFELEEAPFCCGMQVVGDFYEDDTRNSGSSANYKAAVKDLRDKLLEAEARPAGTVRCRTLIATVLTSHEYKLKLLLDAGMVEVKRWINVNTGNEIALLVSPDEWPTLK